jgi:hypothetical protein
MKSNSEVELTVTIQVAGCHLTWIVRNCRLTKRRAELAVAFARQDENAACFTTTHDEIRLLIIIHITDQYVDGRAWYRDRRTWSVPEQWILGCS